MELRAKRETRTILDEELAQLSALDDQREVAWADKLRAVAELARHRGVEFETLYRQLELHLRAGNSD